MGFHKNNKKAIDCIEHVPCHKTQDLGQLAERGLRMATPPKFFGRFIVAVPVRSTRRTAMIRHLEGSQSSSGHLICFPPAPRHSYYNGVTFIRLTARPNQGMIYAAIFSWRILNDFEKPLRVDCYVVLFIVKCLLFTDEWFSWWSCSWLLGYYYRFVSIANVGRRGSECDFC